MTCLIFNESKKLIFLGVFDSSLLSGVPVGDGNMNDVIGSSGTSLAQSALHNSINNYESLVGSPQKLS